MRNITALLAALALVLAACSGDGGDTVPAEEPETTTQATEESTTQAPAADVEEAIQAKVVFDGKTCTYLGPAVVPDGTRLEFVFEATAKPDTVAFLISGLVEGTTWEQIVESAANRTKGELYPPFAASHGPKARMYIGPGSLAMTVTQGDYLVICALSPDDTGAVYPAAIFEVIEG